MQGRRPRFIGNRSQAIDGGPIIRVTERLGGLSRPAVLTSRHSIVAFADGRNRTRDGRAEVCEMGIGDAGSSARAVHSPRRHESERV